MTQYPFGQTFTFKLSGSRAWMSLGSGWAAMAGALAAGVPGLTWGHLLQVIGLWLLVDPILGTLWALAVQQGLWRRVTQASLPQPAGQGFFLPYAQPESMAGQVVILVRRYQVWWQAYYWPEFGGQVVTFGVGLLLALVIGLVLSPSIFWLVGGSISLTLLAGQRPHRLTTKSGGRIPSIVQLLLPWLMGATLWSSLSLFAVGLALCFWISYLGGLRILGDHPRAEWLFFGGQLAVLTLLLGLRVLPGAAVIAVSLASIAMLKNSFDTPAVWLDQAQPYLILSMLTAGVAVGGL
ncbi:MAG: hypothetical protein H6632_03340 [Anaerolineales bacterium]|nr:hypothetical protein [Anaerolineales bacterium]